MNPRREAMLWSISITGSIVLGLVVVWGAIVLAFDQPDLAPLHFAAASYRQDDYSAEVAGAVRFNPLDPGLEQEAVSEDRARNNPMFKVNHPGLASPVSQTLTPAASTDIILPTSTGTPLPTPTNTTSPLPTDTSLPVSTTTSTPVATNSSVATATPQPPRTAEPSTNTPKPHKPPTGTPQPPNTLEPPSTPEPPDTPRLTRSPHPRGTPRSTRSPHPPRTPKPPGTPRPPHHHHHFYLPLQGRGLESVTCYWT
jgi:hypothetical protein